MVECYDPLLEPCSGDVDALLLNIRVKCSCLRAKVAHISGHLPPTCIRVREPGAARMSPPRP